MHKNGFKNTVAVMGTALTESHIHQIKNISENVILCFDNDKAGALAFNRSSEIAGPFLRVQKLSLEGSKDPSQLGLGPDSGTGDHSTFEREAPITTERMLVAVGQGH